MVEFRQNYLYSTTVNFWAIWTLHSVILCWLSDLWIPSVSHALADSYQISVSAPCCYNQPFQPSVASTCNYKHNFPEKANQLMQFIPSFAVFAIKQNDNFLELLTSVLFFKIFRIPFFPFFSPLGHKHICFPFYPLYHSHSQGGLSSRVQSIMRMLPTPSSETTLSLTALTHLAVKDSDLYVILDRPWFCSPFPSLSYRRWK